MFDASSPVIFPFTVILPAKVDTPDTFTLPVTPASPLTNKEVPEAPTAPTSRVNLGLVVPIPTLERVLIPELTTFHEPLTKFKLVPSPK